MTTDTNIVAIIQARMSSGRLPGKVMAEIAGKPMLYHVAKRTKCAKNIDSTVIATSDHDDDNIIESFCRHNDIPCFRGSLDDVLDRYYKAARHFGANVIVRVTADCPLLDADVIDGVICRFIEGNFDYVSNVIECTYPDGLDTEVFSIAALERAWRKARLKSEREHVTPYIRRHPEMFRQASVLYRRDLSHLRWTVDEPADLDFVRSVFAHFDDANFGMEETIRFLEHHPELTGINMGIERNEGYFKSLREDCLLSKVQ